MSNTPPVSIAIQQVELAALRPDPLNPRRIPKQELESLIRSIAQFGFINPIIVRKQDLLVIGGHARLLAAQRLGIKTVPVVLLELSEQDARLLNIALNKIGGEFDDQQLARLLADLGQVPNLDLSLTGFGDDEISRLLAGLDSQEKHTHPEAFDLVAALEASRASPRAQTGELWALGKHRLLVDDACDPQAISRLLGERKAAMCFTEPPSTESLDDHGGHQPGQRWRHLEDDSVATDRRESFVRAWARALLQSVDGALYICLSPQEWLLDCRLLAEAGGHWSDTIIWSKGRSIRGRADYNRQYEPIWYGWREGAAHAWKGGPNQGDVWRIEPPSDSRRTSSPKPLALIERAIENSSQRGDLVLDLFLGSGPTLLACERTGRIAYAIEIDPHFASVAIARWESFSGEKAQKVD